MKLRRLLLAYALTNVVLYSMLLPLWEGFDEPFHFGYVQGLANGDGFPDPRTSRLSKEVGSSLLLTPVSLAVQQNLPTLVSYPEFFSWPEYRRQQAHEKLASIDPNLRWNPSDFINYEGLQAPLAYAVLALPERITARFPLPMRVLMLRIIAGTLGAVLLFLAAIRLVSQLEIISPHGEVALFCAFSSQMIWATMAHVANDWLAVPLTVWLLVTTIDYAKCPSVRRAVSLSILLSLGLLTKAYFIAFIPAIAVCAFRRRWLDLGVSIILLLGLAGPWYVRNLERYNTISGMQELRDGVNPSAAIPYLRIERLPAGIEAYARSALWTGNNTFRTFSIWTLRGLLIAWLFALILWAVTRHRMAEWIVVLHSGLFILALAYNAATNYVGSHGKSASPGAWYGQVLLVPILALGFLGTSRSRKAGRVIATALLLIFGYILATTYWVKLMPLYGGFEGRTSLSSMAMLYVHRLPMLAAGLNELCLGRATYVFLMASVVLVLTVAQQVIFVGLLFFPKKS